MIKCDLFSLATYAEVLCCAADLTGLESSSNGTLMRRDVRTGEVMWDLHLSSPAVSAFMASGAQVALEITAEPAALPALPEGGTCKSANLCIL